MNRIQARKTIQARSPFKHAAHSSMQTIQACASWSANVGRADSADSVNLPQRQPLLLSPIKLHKASILTLKYRLEPVPRKKAPGQDSVGRCKRGAPKMSRPR
ncbi:MAG: hypothetical protein WBW06_05330 [Xanthobacteraceae bacterium]